jgi:proteasome assembly chaperone (PAC2) family protein
MQLLHWDHRPSELRAPALICAFGGWNDAGEAATAALKFLASALEAKRFAWADAEELFDYQATRPTVRLRESGARSIEWPRLELSAARVPRAPRDVVLLQGPEPSLRWRSLAEQIVELAEVLGVQLVVSIGALLAEVAHTRPVPLTALASDPALIERFGLRSSSYEGPTGIVGVLHSSFARRGVPAVSLWASVPHYVAAAPNPKAALALVRRVEALIGVTVDASALERAAGEYERQVGLAVAADPDVQSFVERLEQNGSEEDEALLWSELPSGELIAREFQRFLRQRGAEGS